MAAVMSCENALYHFMLTNIESGWDVGDFMLRDSIVTPMFKLGLYSPEMIPNPEMIPKSTRNDPHFSSRRPRNDPQLILGIELAFRHGIITNLLQRLRS